MNGFGLDIGLANNLSHNAQLVGSAKFNSDSGAWNNLLI